MSKISRFLDISLPFQVAWAVPAAVLVLMYLAVGATPTAAVVGGLIGGFVGLFGAALAEIVRGLQARRYGERRLEQTEKFLRDRDEPPDRG